MDGEADWTSFHPASSIWRRACAQQAQLWIQKSQLQPAATLNLWRSLVLAVTTNKTKQKSGNALIQYWTTLSWLNPSVPRHTTQWPERLCQRVSPASCLLDTMKKRAKHFLHASVDLMMQNVCTDVSPPLPPGGRFITRGTIAPCPNISVDREKVGVVYYWTGWCIDRPGSRPDFGGLAALLSSLSFPQHQSRWLQLPTDQRCNGLVSCRKARGEALPAEQDVG